MQHYRKEMEIRSELKRIGREIKMDHDISYGELAYIQCHTAEILKMGDIVLAEWAGIEEETYHEYMRTHEHANR